MIRAHASCKGYKVTASTKKGAIAAAVIAISEPKPLTSIFGLLDAFSKLGQRDEPIKPIPPIMGRFAITEFFYPTLSYIVNSGKYTDSSSTNTMTAKITMMIGSSTESARAEAVSTSLS